MKSMSHIVTLAAMAAFAASASAELMVEMSPAKLAMSSDEILVGHVIDADIAGNGQGSRHLVVGVDRVLVGRDTASGQVVRIAVPVGNDDDFREGKYGIFFLGHDSQGLILKDGEQAVGVATSRDVIYAPAASVNERIAEELVSALVSDDATIVAAYGAQAGGTFPSPRDIVAITRTDALSQLSMMPPAVVKPLVMKAASASPDDVRVQLICADALLRVKDTGLLKGVTSALLSPNPQYDSLVHDIAVQYLVGHWDAAEADTARLLLKSSSDEVRKAASIVLDRVATTKPAVAPPASTGAHFVNQRDPG